MFWPPEHEIRFQWGEVRTRYKVGDAVRWLTLPSGDTLPPFRSVPDRRDHVDHWNYGEPTFREVIAFEIDPHEPEFICKHCGERYAHAAAVVSEGRFIGGIVYKTRDEVIYEFGATPDEFEVVTRMPDGTWRARTDWSNPLITRFEP
jgi:hypothetical protein